MIIRTIMLNKIDVSSMILPRVNFFNYSYVVSYIPSAYPDNYTISVNFSYLKNINNKSIKRYPEFG